MTITPSTLFRTAGVAAGGAGLVFIGVNVGHPHLDAVSITTTEVVVRSSLKVAMAVLALVGITGMYLRQVRQTGVLGLAGYLLLSTSYLLIMSTNVIAAAVLPELADTNPSYVSDILARATGGTPSGDIGLQGLVFQVQDVGYLAGGLVFGFALYRARVLARWASALLAVGGLVTVALALMPDAFYRLLAYPNGIAMIGLGWSLWSIARRDAIADPSTAPHPHVATAGAE